MPQQSYNDWSPWMRALMMADDAPSPEQQAAATPAQPDTSAPPAHRIEDDRTAGTRGTTPQSPTTTYDPVAESRAYDPAPGRRTIARAPLESVIGKDQAELDRINAPSKPLTLGQRIGSVIGTMATAGRGEAAVAQETTLRDRAAARKQQERESLGARISANTRQLSQESEAEANKQEQEEFQRGQTRALIEGRARNVVVQQEGQTARTDAQIESREGMAADKRTDALAMFKTTDQYRRWKDQQDNATKLEIAKLRGQAVQNKAPAALMQTAVFAQGGIKSLNDAKAAMAELKAAGVMGQSWAQNKVEDWVFGKGAIDPSVPPQIRQTIGKLRQALNLSASAMTRAHTQRGSVEVYNDLKRSLGPGQDWAALDGAIDESQDMLGLYVQAASDQSIANIRAGGGGTAAPTPDGQPKATHKFVNGKLVPVGPQ
jgi:hypothetical protein